MSTNAKPRGVVAPSLAEFVSARKRKDCTVCKLSLGVQAQLGKTATQKGYTRDDQLAWLHDACKAPHITNEELSKHLSAGHFRINQEASA